MACRLSVYPDKLLTTNWAGQLYVSVEMGIEPNPNRKNRTRTYILGKPNRTRTHAEKAYIDLKPNRTHQCDEPEPNPNLLTEVLVGFNKFGFSKMQYEVTFRK